jgi:Kef-type K+ transport system membrane component KefB
MNRLILLIGIAVILGSIGGRIFARLRIPQVVGYIVIPGFSVRKYMNRRKSAQNQCLRY